MQPTRAGRAAARLRRVGLRYVCRPEEGNNGPLTASYQSGHDALVGGAGRRGRSRRLPPRLDTVHGLMGWGGACPS
jgi:hypothetical protein